MSTSWPGTAEPGWYEDPQIGGTLRYFDGTSWTDHWAPAPQRQYAPRPLDGMGESPSDPMHWLLPTGRSWQSIAAGYVGLFALVIWPLGVVAIALGVWALIVSGRTGTHGRGRAVFGIVTGVIATFALLAVLAQSF